MFDGGEEPMTRANVYRLIQAASIILFFVQALKVMFSVLFGIIYDGIFEGPFSIWLVVSNFLLVAAFILPGVINRRIAENHLNIMVLVAGFARVGLDVNFADTRYWSALVVIAASLIYLVALLKFHRSYLFAGVVLALFLDQLLKTMGITLDISLRPGWLPVQLAWALALIWINMRADGEIGENSPAANGIGLGEGLAIGGFFYLQVSLLSLPNALARWTGISYNVIAPFLLAFTALFLVLGVQRFTLRWISSGLIRVGLVVILCAGLMLGYFKSGAGPLFGLLLSQGASLSLVLVIASRGDVSKERTGLALSVGMLFFLILNFSNAFAFTYPYTLPAMKGMGWAVYLAAGVSLILITLSWSSPARPNLVSLRGARLAPLAFAVAIALLFVRPVATEELAPSGSLRFATYNIHYGYDDAWHYTLEAIAETIEENDCDIVAMQEVDTGRLTSYGVDNAVYLAHRLKMNVLYLPTVEHLTGIAILYRGTPGVERSTLISSLQEQTGIAQIILGKSGVRFHAFGIWMGLSDEDTHTQIVEALDFIRGQSPAMFAGDFNADPSSEVATEIRQVGFSDPFETLRIVPAPNTSPAIHPENRIDFVWLRGFDPISAWVSDSLASDHRMVVVEVELPE